MGGEGASVGWCCGDWERWGGEGEGKGERERGKGKGVGR